MSSILKKLEQMINLDNLVLVFQSSFFLALLMNICYYKHFIQSLRDSPSLEFSRLLSALLHQGSPGLPYLRHSSASFAMHGSRLPLPCTGTQFQTNTLTWILVTATSSSSAIFPPLLSCDSYEPMGGYQITDIYISQVESS